MQLSLSILEDPIAERNVWKQINNDEQQAVVEVLARLIALAATFPQNEEKNHD